MADIFLLSRQSASVSKRDYDVTTGERNVGLSRLIQL